MRVEINYPLDNFDDANLELYARASHQTLQLRKLFARDDSLTPDDLAYGLVLVHNLTATRFEQQAKLIYNTITRINASEVETNARLSVIEQKVDELNEGIKTLSMVMSVFHDRLTEQKKS